MMVLSRARQKTDRQRAIEIMVRAKVDGRGTSSSPSCAAVSSFMTSVAASSFVMMGASGPGCRVVEFGCFSSMSVAVSSPEFVM